MERAPAYALPVSLRTSPSRSLSSSAATKEPCLAQQDGVCECGLVVESGILQHLNPLVDDAVGFSEARAYGGEPARDTGIFPQSAAQFPQKKPEPRGFQPLQGPGREISALTRSMTRWTTSSLRPTW